MSTGYSDSFLFYNIQLLKTVCLWPLDSKSPFLLTLNAIYTVFLAVSLAVVSFGQIIEIFMSPNVSSMASAVDLMTLTTSALFKMIYIKFYYKYYQDLVTKIDSTFLQADFSGNTFHMSHWLKDTRFYINFYAILAPLGLMPVFIAPYLSIYFPFFDSLPLQETNIVTPIDDSSLQDRYQIGRNDFSSTFNFTLLNGMSGNGDGHLSPKKRAFPFNCWLPIDATWSPLYEVVYIWELFPLLGCGCVYLISDTFFFMIIYLACGQLEILKTNLRSIPEQFASAQDLTSSASPDIVENNSARKLSPIFWNAYSREKEIERKMDEAISKCVDFHNNILSVIRDLDHMLRSLIVADFLHAVISLSFAMLQTVISNSIFQWFQMLLFIVVCIFHQFCNNFFAEMLIQQQMSVADVAYNTPWVEASAKFKTAVRMMIVQARLPIRISGWKMYKLGLGTFVEFMRLLSSYFLVLQSLHTEESSGK